MNKEKRKTIISGITDRSYSIESFGFNKDLLERIVEISDYRSNLFQEIILTDFNEFKITVFKENLILFDFEKIEQFNRIDIENIFTQFIAIENFIIENEIDFIDIESFSIVNNNDTYFVKFEIQFKKNKSNNGIEFIINLFKRNRFFYDLSLINYWTKLRECLKRNKGKVRSYVYRYRDFSSNFLDLYNLNGINKNSNTLIKINSFDQNIYTIIKSYLFADLFSDNILFLNFDKLHGSILEYMKKELNFYFGVDSQNLTFLNIIDRLEEYILMSSVKSFIIFLDKRLDEEENNFIEFLINMSSVNNLILISFGVELNIEFDLELNENPKNYLPLFDYNKSKKINKKENDKSINENKKIIDKIEKGEFSKVLVLVKKMLNNRGTEFISSFLTKALYENYSKICKSEELVAFLIDILFEEENLKIVETVLNKTERKSLIYRIKITQLYRLKRDYVRFKTAVLKYLKKIPDKYVSEYFYLKFYFEDKFGDTKKADKYYNRIDNLYYKNLANIQMSYRLINIGNLESAYKILKSGLIYFKKNGYLSKELETKGQIAKYYREKGNNAKAESLYKSILFESESRKLNLLTASISLDLGNLYYTIDDLNQSEFWYKRALKKYETVKNNNGISICKFNLNEIYKYKGEWNKAEQFFENSLMTDEKEERSESFAIDCYNISHLEFLRNDIEKSIKFNKYALDGFKKKNIITGIIEAKLLYFRLKFSTLKQNDLDEFKNNYFRLCNEDKKYEFTLIESVYNGKSKKDLLEILSNINSLRLRFEMFVFYIKINKDKSVLKFFEAITSKLNKRVRNYFFYEYYYIFFGFYSDVNAFTEEERILFLDMYYFFLKNGRILSEIIQNIKKKLSRNDAIRELFDNVKSVEDYKKWDTMSDFFFSLSNDLQEKLRADFIFLKIYSNKKLLYELSNEKQFKELIDELIIKMENNINPLTLLTDEINLLNTDKKIFYQYSVTKVYPWRISDDLFAVLVLGFKSIEKKNIDVYTENVNLFSRYSLLFSEFYRDKIINKEKMSFLLGSSKSLADVKKKIIKLSERDFPILITGESGTGKELIAKAIHNLSKRENNPFITVNIAAIPDSLIEAELFGTRKGAFTGANEDRIGLIEFANGGTLFLDEIAEIPINLQAKLLRTLESGEIRRLGENKIRKIDFRILSATNKNLENMIKNGSFREDLFYRIANIEIKVPPLRERKEDIPILVKHFLRKYKFEIDDEGEINKIIDYLTGLTYRGNIRELQSKVKEIIAYYPDYKIDYLKNNISNNDNDFLKLRDNFEKSLIIKVLKENDNNKTLTANSLKISRTYLMKLIKKYDI